MEEIPVSRKRFVISFSLHFTSFNRYSLSPDLKYFLVTVTVEYSVGIKFFVLSNDIETSANCSFFLDLEPLKIIFSILSDLSKLVFCSPKTHLIASTTLDFPQPLGPTIPVTPLLKFITVLSPKLLNPLISNLFNLIK